MDRRIRPMIGGDSVVRVVIDYTVVGAWLVLQML